MTFLPDNYKVPSASDNYMKFKKGENKFRILGDPILGWETWVNTEDGGRKPLRTPMDKPFTTEQVDNPEDIKHFWAMPVWNYDAERVQILEITQKGIQKSIRAMERSKDWGNPLNYDILVTREGEGLKTKYSVNPVPPKKLTKEIKEAWKKSDINLEALYEGEDPFANESDLSDEDIDEILED